MMSEVKGNGVPRPRFPNGYSLGLDLGSNSVGWAAIGEKPGEVHLGVRVFAEGTKRDKTETSRAAARREARQARRGHDRRKRRWKKTANVLVRAGLLPARPADAPETQVADPYQLRARALDERLEPYEFGRALYHLGKRRGFKSGRKAAEGEEEKESKKVGEAISKLQEAIETDGARTLGEYLSGIDPHEHRIRERYTSRAQVEHEFEAIWAAQQPHHPEILTDALHDELHAAIFFQRPLKPMSDRIGKCPLEPEERRAAKASWIAHQFRILKEVNNLRILTQEGERELEPSEREMVLHLLTTQKSRVKFDKIKKALGLGELDSVNLEAADRPGLDPNVIEASLAKIFKKRWEKDADLLTREVWSCFIDETLPDGEFDRRAREEWNISPADISEMRKIRGGSGHVRLSEAAMYKMLPHLERGLGEYDAKVAVYGEAIAAAAELAFMPPIDDDDITNPVVRRTLSETRKVVNALIREYGKPKRIVIELARDAKGSIQQRAEYASKNRQLEAERDKARAALLEKNINPSGGNIRKYLLWEECGHMCPYTGRCIGFDKLFGNPPEFEIEHIFPYGRSCDNSWMNVTLCDKKYNATRKRNKTPVEACGEGSEELNAIVARLRHMRAMPYPKKKRFTMREIPDDFTRSQLVDTSYASRQVRERLKQVVEKVDTTKGHVTATLRHYWGLDTILARETEGETAPTGKKERLDHRHHAIDAAAVAMTTAGIHQRLSRRYDEGTEFQIPEPWKNFRHDIAAAVEGINVSYRPERKLNAGFSKETNYGRRTLGDGRERFVRRVPVESLTPGMVPRIIDKRVREIVTARYQSAGGGGKPEPGWAEGLAMQANDGRHIPIKKVRIHEDAKYMIPVPEGDPVRFVPSDDNHHFALYLSEEGSRRTYTVYVCSRYEALQRWRLGGPLVLPHHPDDSCSRLVIWLMKNDMVLYRSEDSGDPFLCRVEELSGPPRAKTGDVVFRPHTVAVTDEKRYPELRTKPFKFRNTGWSAAKLELDGVLRFQKIGCDPLGRLHPINDVPDHRGVGGGG